MEIEAILKLVIAIILGATIGLEREIKRKEAGLQTYTLVVLGTCLFTLIIIELFKSLPDKAGIVFDPAAIVQAITIGIGFIGAGVIFRQSSGTIGLTTAAGLWTAAAIGVAIGVGFYSLALFSTLLTLLILAGFGLVEERLLINIKNRKED